RWTAFWIAPVVGLVVGVIAAIGLSAVLPAVLQSGTLSYILTKLPDIGDVVIGCNVQIESTIIEGPPFELIGPGILGALVGTVLWLIGRPDRPLERDAFSSNQHLALVHRWRMIPRVKPEGMLFRKPVSTFPDHALVVTALSRSIVIFVPPAPVDSVLRMSPCARTMLA